MISSSHVGTNERVREETGLTVKDNYYHKTEVIWIYVINLSSVKYLDNDR